MLLKNIRLSFVITAVLIAGIMFLSTTASAAACTLIVDNTNNSGSGSLRSAINTANSNNNLDVVCFSISSGSQQIIPSSALPPIVNPIVIDGSTQPGFDSGNNRPLIELIGSSAGSGSFGLRITGNGSGSTIRSLVINRFESNGIFIDSSNNIIVGNYIGTNSNASAALSNKGDGIGIFSGTSVAFANGNRIGGITPADRNIISGNGLNSVGANGIGITAQDGGNASSNVISGNYIGTNENGTATIPNRGDGILVNNPSNSAQVVASANIIGGNSGTSPGGNCTGACNLISGNAANGIGLWHTGVQNTLVSGNFVGTDYTGNYRVSNGNIGIEVNETPNNTVGGTAQNDRNLFSGNAGAGVFLTGVDSKNNVVLGNYIGTNTNGTSGLGNIKMGIGVGASPGAIGANSNTIGGTTGVTPTGACTGACNLISGNGQNGIFITGSESYGHRIVGNYIGTNVAGTSSIGNGYDGVGLLGTPNTIIGGTSNLERNVISGNVSNGIIIAGSSATGNRIEGNSIGLSSAPTPLGNRASGVSVSTATDTAIIGNNIAYNGLLGIDLDNNGTVNKNDASDGDTGANRLQNFPNIYSAKTVNGTTKLGGNFNGMPSTSFRLDFFASDGCNAGKPNNYGEGQNYIGSSNISTDIYGNTAFGFSPNQAVSGGKYITSTATKRIGNTDAETSEFSLCRLINVSKPALTNGATWYLKDDLTSGGADYTFGYGFPSTLLMCAWDPNQPGVKLPVVYSNGNWFMRASYTTGTADQSFNYGSGDYQPVCGDWNGDGVDSPGLVNKNATWYLRNSNNGGGPDAGNFQFGPYGAKPVVGDWDGNGNDTIGVVSNDSTWYLRNSNNGGGPDAGNFQFGPYGAKPVVGDWDGNGNDTIGVVSGARWYLRNVNLNGGADVIFDYGVSGAEPIIW